MNLNQVTLPCIDYDESVKFYQALGFRLIVNSPPHYARFECGADDRFSTFSLHGVDAAHAATSGDVVIYFELDSAEALDKKVRELQAQAIQIEQMPVDQPWLWREAYLRDPAGNRLCLYYAGANRRSPPWRI